MSQTFKFIVSLALLLHSGLIQASGGWCFGIYLLESCRLLSDEYDHKTRDIISRLRVSTSEISQELETCPGEMTFTPEHKEQIKNLSAESREKAKKECDEMLANAALKLEPPDDRFSTPGKTWALFIAAPKNGDKDTILKCLSGRAKQNLFPFFSTSSKDKLREMGESFTSFQVMGDMGEMQDAIVTRSNGKAGVVIFAKQGSNWKIEDM